MKYAALLQYTQDKALIADCRPKHRQHLQDLLAKGKLVMAGPFTDDSGAILVYEVADEAEAKRCVETDPFHGAGVFVRYELKPWKAVMCNRSLLPDGFPG